MFATIFALLGVFRSLSYNHDLASLSLLFQATQKLPLNLKEALSMYTVNKNCDCPYLLDFNDWLKDKSEAHGKRKLSSGKTETEDGNAYDDLIRTKTGAENFAATSSSQTPSMGEWTENRLTSCIAPKKASLKALFGVPRKDAYLTDKNDCRQQISFSWMYRQLLFCRRPKPRNSIKQGSSSSQNTLLYGSERIFLKESRKKLTELRKLWNAM